MELAERRRQRLAQMLDLAQNYRGWTRKELAQALGRDPTKLIPGSGVPKLDLVVDLSQVLGDATFAPARRNALAAARRNGAKPSARPRPARAPRRCGSPTTTARRWL